MLDQLRETCRSLLQDGTVKVVIGYGESQPGKPARPLFVTRPEEANQLVWNPQCLSNLTVYLKQKEIRALGKPALVVKGCDERALVVLEQEAQIERKEIYVIGMACSGMGEPQQSKCGICDVRLPRFADKVIGTAEMNPPSSGNRYAELEKLLSQSPAERMAFWSKEFSRCTKCYACRQVCPLCYCERCIVDKNRPVCIDTSATLKGNFAWHIARAFHLAARCVGCGECTRACPAGIDLGLLNLVLAKAAEEQFAYRAGMDPKTQPVTGSYNLADREDFIG